MGVGGEWAVWNSLKNFTKSSSPITFLQTWYNHKSLTSGGTWLVSLFNDISTGVGYLMANPSS